jgi:[protein-PII] uridylyltransferase
VGSEPAEWNDSRVASLKQRVIEELHPDILPNDIERHLAEPPERYLRSTDPAKIAREIRLIEQLGQRGGVLMNWLTLGKHCSELTICTRDRVGLFASIAGALTAQGVNILSANLHTREDGIVIDVFELCDAVNHHPIPADKQPMIQVKVEASINNEYDLEAAIEKWRQQSPRRLKRNNQRAKPPAVAFDSESSAGNTIIEVRANDEVGLAYKLAHALSESKLNITFAKIATEKSQALDIFYVTDSNGSKLSQSLMMEVEQSLMRVVGRARVAEIA